MISDLRTQISGYLYGISPPDNPQVEKKPETKENRAEVSSENVWLAYDRGLLDNHEIHFTLKDAYPTRNRLLVRLRFFNSWSRFLGEGDPMHRAAAAVGHPPDGPPSHRPPLPRVPRRDGAARLDPHPAQWVASAFSTGEINSSFLDLGHLLRHFLVLSVSVSSFTDQNIFYLKLVGTFTIIIVCYILLYNNYRLPGYLHARRYYGGASGLGRREDGGHHLQLHARLLLTHGIQADALRYIYSRRCHITSAAK